jgi:hypothetical protein
MPVCTAFTKQSTPCTSHIYTHERTLCGRHLPMVATPEKEARFNREQERFRANWRSIQAGTHVRVGNRIVPVGTLPVEVRERPPPIVRPICVAVKSNGAACDKHAVHDDNRCNIHHAVLVRQEQNEIIHRAMREIRNIYDIFMHNPNVAAATIEEAMPRLSQGLTERNQQRLRDQADDYSLRPMFHALRRLVDQGATFEQADAQVQAWITNGTLAMRFVPNLHQQIQVYIQIRDWHVVHRPVFRADQREAQLAADSQNVHTREITQQMKDSINILLAVQVPPEQTGSVREMRVGWLEKGYSEYEINMVYRDVVNWWNKDTIFSENDKLYRRILRGLWWTIKQYKADVRAELEQRLWEELRDGAIPYSVCTQGHVARISNVMIGFDDAFVPTIPVGEILQQKMAAIYAMDVDYEEQIRLAEAVLEELQIPREQYGSWLSAF